METIQKRFSDDGRIPNNIFPLVIYRQAYQQEQVSANLFEEIFEANNWKNSWRNGIYPYHHYHSITHEVIGIYAGSAELQLGGDTGEAVTVFAGDVIVIPAGTGHKKISASDDFAVVGAYPDRMDFDLLKGDDGERPKADENIKKVPFPETDPILGKGAGIVLLWQ